MRDDDPSRTAELVCICRAVARRDPPQVRLLDDPYAERFLGPLHKAAGRAYAATRRFGPRLVSALGPSIVTYIQVRHRFIDDALRDALGRGVQQVVIAGAGYDCRAYRFADALRGRPVFELDFPSTARRKAKKLREMQGLLPEVNVHRGEVDFRTERASHALGRTGFDPARSTFFVWEGVSMYLTRAAVKETLEDFRGIAAPGSELALDFWYLVDSSDLASTAHRISPNLLHFLGEPIVFGMHPEDVPDFLARQGLVAIEVMEGPALSARYGLEARAIMPGVYVARATLDSGHRTQVMLENK